MKHKCPVCGLEYELDAHTLPCCPHCIKTKMVHPDGLSPKHTLSGAKASSSYASYIADGVQPDKVFDYMTGGVHTSPSGCELFYSTTHNSWNAVSNLPLQQIPGSGIGPGGPHAAEFAVLADIEGKSSQGPHWMFEDATSLQNRQARGEWTPAIKCVQCGDVRVFNAGDVCLNCQAKGNAAP